MIPELLDFAPWLPKTGYNALSWGDPAVLEMEGSSVAVREMKEEIFKQDRLKVVDRCREKAPVIAEVAERIGWARLWDAVLDFGGKAVRGLQNLSRAMSHHGRGSYPCRLCDVAPLTPQVAEGT